ncbi:MAG: YbbR-like domain-containing protein, partial [Peptococcus niger]
YQAQPRDVFVAGDPGVLKNVAKAVVQVQLGDIYESGVLDLPVVLLDAKGQVLHLPGVAVKPKSVNLTITLNKDAREKTVAVVPAVNGKAADGYVLTAAKAEPETITVSGPADILADVDQVTTETIDITNMQNNRQVTVSLKLPQGVRSAGKGDIRVNLSFAKKKEASLEAEIPIEIQQLSTGLNAELNQSMVRVRYMPIGGSTQVYAVVDASGLGVGQHLVDVNAYTSDGSVVEQVVPQQVTVTIT